jgi:hypothetical protein
LVGLKPLDQSRANLAQVMTISTFGEGTKLVVIASGVSSAQHYEVVVLFCFVKLFLL